MPDCCDSGEGRVLEGYAQGGVFWGDGNMQGACPLALASNNASVELIEAMRRGREKSPLRSRVQE